MNLKIIIAGGTGFIGKYLEKRFTESGDHVSIISRKNPHLNWENETNLIEALNGADLLINLAGKSVDCRYNEKNKRLIMSSRVNTTRHLQTAIDHCGNPPKLWINASTATIYRHAEDRPMDEENGEIGTGFSVGIAKAWEGAFFEKQDDSTRKIALRIAITLGKNGGVMKPYENMVKYGLGGRQGNGNQMFSWIHIEDLFHIIQFALEHKEMSGIYNASAPNPLRNVMLMKALRNFLKPPFYFSSPAWLLKAGAFFINTETELILKSRWVIPKKISELGFQFEYPTIEKALKDIMGK